MFIRSHQLELSVAASANTITALLLEAFRAHKFVERICRPVCGEVDPLLLLVVFAEDDEVRVMPSNPPELDIGVLVQVPGGFEEILNSAEFIQLSAGTGLYLCLGGEYGGQ